MKSYSIATQKVLGAAEVREKSLTVVTKDGLTECIESIISKRNDDFEEAFYVLDLDVVTFLYEKWTSRLPLIQPFYAVKCNPDKAFLGTLAAFGANFDCASKAEIEAVLSLGVSPKRIIYANTCKAVSHIKYAASVGVNLATFDSIEELHKIQRWHPKCSLLIRLKVADNGKAKRPLSFKFGTLPTEVLPLLQATKTMQLNVIGVAFHVGSAIIDPSAYNEAIAAAKNVFDTATQLGMPKMHVLDIGGGFVDDAKFDQVAKSVNAAVEAYFPDEPRLSIIAEPGRFFAETAFTLAANIIGKRIRGEVREYWINDGIYGSFNCIPHATLSGPINCMPLACMSNSKSVTCKGLKTYNSTVYGHTCDSEDFVVKDYQLPELEVNDRLVFPNMGAYSIAMGSCFNGFTTPVVSTYVVTSK